jgi:thymidylate synthase
MTNYIPAVLAKQLILGSGYPVVIVGWTVAKSVAKKLNPSDYSVIGQLYSAANGLSPLMRNILANKGHTHLILLEGTREDANAGSIKCLMDFFRYGFYMGATDMGHQCWVVDSSVAGYIDKEIPESALNWVRNSVKVTRVETIGEVMEQCKKLKFIAAQDVKPELFPHADPPTCPMYPGPFYGHVIRGARVADTWVKIVNRIRTTGQVRDNGCEGPRQELIDLVAVVENEPKEFYFPEPNYLPISRKFIEGYLPQILEDAPEQEDVKYTYGQRLRSWFGADQVEQVITKLGLDIDSASAVMDLWDVKDHDRGSAPCLNHIWVRVNGRRLTLTALFRSNDMFSAWPANAMGLRALQFHICDEINRRYGSEVYAGELITISQSAHIYENCFTVCDTMRAKFKSTVDYNDPTGNYIITVDGGKIKVKWTTPATGATVKVYEGVWALQLIKKITYDAPYLEAGHAAYLGFELARAESARNGGREYRQDSP